MKKYIGILSVFLIIFVVVSILTGCVKKESIENNEVNETSDKVSYPKNENLLSGWIKMVKKYLGMLSTLLQ